MKKTFVVVVCILASACAAKKDDPGSAAQPSSGATATAAVHLAFRTYDGQGKLTSNVVQADRQLTLKSIYDSQPASGDYVDVDESKGYDNESSPAYRFSLQVQGAGGVRGLPEASMKGLNAHLGFFLPDVTPGKTYECGVADGSPNACRRSFGVYAIGDEVKDAFGRVTSPSSPLLFNEPGSAKCTFAVGEDSVNLTLKKEEIPGYRTYFRSGRLPSGPDAGGTDYAPDALKKFAFAIRCVDPVTSVDLLYATYTQNGAKLPNL